MKVLALFVCLAVASSSANQEGVIRDIVCDTCEFVGHEIDSRLLTKDTKAKILDFGKTICGKLPMFAKECTDAVSTYGPEAIAELFKKFDVDRICAQVHLCPASHVIDSASFLAVGETGGCRACKDGMDVIAMVINSAEVRDMLHIAVNESCMAASSTKNVARCEALAGKILDEILHNLLPLFDSEGICNSMGVCHAPHATLLKTTKEGCKACVAGLDLVDLVLKSDDLKDLADIAVDEMCMAMGGRVDVCEKILRGIIDPIIANVVELFDPKALCAQAGACPAKKTALESDNGNGIFCDPCKESVLEIHNIVEDQETETVLMELTTIVCNVIEIPFCKSVMKAIINESLQDLDNLSPDAMCTNIGACHASITPAPVASFLKVGDECSDCTAIAQQVIDALENEEVQTLLKDAIGELCSILPIPDCTATLDGYLTEIIALLKTLDAKTLCSLIGLC